MARWTREMVERAFGEAHSTKKEKPAKPPVSFWSAGDQMLRAWLLRALQQA